MSNLAKLSENAERTFCTFRVQDRLYGIDVSHVREVSTHTAVTQVPQAPPVVRGLTNLRSRIYLVLDLRPALGFASEASTPESRLVVLQAHVAEHVGVLVDRGGEIVKVAVEQIEDAADEAATGQATGGGAARRSVVAGVCKLQNELMMIVDPARLIEQTEKAIG